MGETFKQAAARVKEAAPLKAWCEAHLQPIGRTFACPVCGSGTGPSHSPAFNISSDGQKWKCFSCNAGGDVLDLAGIYHNLTDAKDKLRAVAEWAGVDDGMGDDGRGRPLGYDDMGTVEDEPRAKGAPKGAKGAETAHETGAKDANGYEDGRARERAYIKECQARIDDPAAQAYLTARGITADDARAWGLGYDPRPRHGWTDAEGRAYRGGRIVIPWAGSDYYHADRAMDDEGSRAKDKKYVKPSSNDVGAQPTWNPAALKAGAFVVVEGALDALAVQACGAEAVCLGGVNNHAVLTAEIAATEGHGVPVVMLDDDEVGRREAQKFTAALDEKGIAYVTGSTSGLGTKDAGEAWAKDRAVLKKCVEGLLEQARAKAEEADGAEAWEAVMADRYHVEAARGVIEGLYDLKGATEPIPTGFTMLDNLMGGGLQPRALHIIGAQSSEGKTTLTLQICDHVAAQGHPVLFCTIEQRPDELAAKSIARTIWQNRRRDLQLESGGITAPLHLTARDILNPQQRKRWGTKEWDAFTSEAGRYYGQVSDNLYFMGPEARAKVSDVRAAALKIYGRTGEPPVVFIDYVQLLQPEAGHEKDGDKQLTDAAVTALRQLAGELRTPVWCVASLNRQSYTAPIATDSFKESGSLEYSADILLGLEPFELRTRYNNAAQNKRAITALGMHEATRQATKRWMDCVILKNRFGWLPKDPLAFVYRADYDTFEEVTSVRRDAVASSDDGVQVGPRQ